ncbi:RNA methyltransferase [Blastococcus sp. Marseille-P5729]|uniref:TrmH family RNA methyltransferase n=1 Tax=Blastococcus sp. Marseille-P5729 TaxID=2086582 RepID=UPI000D11099A|nr:RNA methyltransferase [Blastococcus sp. Marseille-P5729]
MNPPAPQPGQVATARSARVAASRKLLRRAVRREQQAFLADGPQAVREALRFHGSAGGAAHPNGLCVHVEEVYVDAALTERHAELLALAAQRSVPAVHCDAKAIASLSDAVTPQGILARCATLDVPLHTLVDNGRRPLETSQDDNARIHRPRLLAVPVDVRDPGNLGTIIRCADASGSDGIAVLGDSVDVYNPKTVRSTAGSLFHSPIAVQGDTVAAIRSMQAGGLQVIATEGEASLDLDDAIDTGRLERPTAWLFGNEAHGLPDEIAGLADLRIRIPIRGLAESLNLSTAAAICLFASARAHRWPPGMTLGGHR